MHAPARWMEKALLDLLPLAHVHVHCWQAWPGLAWLPSRWMEKALPVLASARSRSTSTADLPGLAWPGLASVRKQTDVDLDGWITLSGMMGPR